MYLIHTLSVLNLNMDSLPTTTDQSLIADTSPTDPPLIVPSPTDPPLIVPSPILLFYSQSTKSQNATSNDAREQILAEILTTPDDVLATRPDSDKWFHIRNSLSTTLHSLVDSSAIPHDSVRLIHKGGRGNNYDYVAQYLHSESDGSTQRIVHSIPLEFKCNCAGIVKLAQFLELTDADCFTKYEMMTVSYSTYYYNTHLDEYINTDIAGICVPKPPIESYIANVQPANYSSEFIQCLYRQKNVEKEKKHAVVKKSMAEYIRTYVSEFRFDKIEQKIRNSQKDKIFLLWNNGAFRTETLDLSRFAIVGVKPNSVKTSKFVLETSPEFKFDIRVMLNWGNNNGVANPRWKFTYCFK